jgi:chromate reductase
MHFVGIPGSIRAASLNRVLLQAFGTQVEAPHTFGIVDIGDLPLYSEDLDAHGDRPAPASVTAFRAAIAAADALVIATPEYNRGYPGALKNALDWGSRPHGAAPLPNKHVAVIGGGGMTGGLRAQMQLRQVLDGCGCHVLVRPELAIRFGETFKDGQLVDPKTIEMLGRIAGALVSQAQRP